MAANPACCCGREGHMHFKPFSCGQNVWQLRFRDFELATARGHTGNPYARFTVVGYDEENGSSMAYDDAAEMEVPWLEREFGCSCMQGQGQGCHQGKPDQENDSRTTAASFRQGESHRTQNLQAIARVVKISEGHAGRTGSRASSNGVICALRKLPRLRPGPRGWVAGTRGDRGAGHSLPRVSGSIAGNSSSLSMSR